MMSDSASNRIWVYRVAVLLTCTVFPLIWLGGLVTTYDAGMAVPDWPNTYNQNMFAFPLRDWFFGPWDLFVEHGHRMLATLSGLIAIVLVAVAYRFEDRRWVRSLAIGALLLVIVQGVLGGMRVLLDARSIAKLHGCVGPLFFAYSVGLCVVTSRWWASQEPRQLPKRNTAVVFAGIMVAASYLQLVLGAFLRHIDVEAPAKLYTILVMSHGTVAVLILLGALVQWFLVSRDKVAFRDVRGSLALLILLIAAQVGVGIGTWVVKFGWPIWFENYHFAAQFVIPEKSFFQMTLITIHVAVGSLLVAGWTRLFLRCGRIAQFVPPVDDDVDPKEP